MLDWFLEKYAGHQTVQQPTRLLRCSTCAKVVSENDTSRGRCLGHTLRYADETWGNTIKWLLNR